MKEQWRVIKEAKASGNSGSVYVPREWIASQWRYAYTMPKKSR